MSTPTRITKAQALAALEAAVADYGEDFVDPNVGGAGFCAYTYELDGRVCHCIAGRALVELGVPIPDERGDRDVASCSLTSSGGGPARRQWAATFPEVPYPPLTNAAARVLGAAQDAQDVGRTWGDALAAARKAMTPGGAA